MIRFYFRVFIECLSISPMEWHLYIKARLAQNYYQRNIDWDVFIHENGEFVKSVGEWLEVKYGNHRGISDEIKKTI